jgi:hypothetical protein
MSPRLRLRIEYSVESGDSKAVYLYAKGNRRELTYEAMDEVLRANISEAELAVVTGVLDQIDLDPEHVSSAFADAIFLTHQTNAQPVRSYCGERGSDQFDILFKLWIELDRLRGRYFTPRFY